MPLELEGTKLAVDFEGYLVDPAQWNEQVAEELARQEHLVLTGEHWAVIRFCASTTSGTRSRRMPVTS